MIQRLRFILESTLQVVYPSCCCVCNKDLVTGEQHLCAACAYDLPYITGNDQDRTKLAKLFWGRVEIQGIYAWLNYQKGIDVQAILHEIKYKNKPKIATHLGSLLAKTIPNDHDFSCIVPVPLHPKKQQKRGFNQSTAIAEGIAKVLRYPSMKNASAATRITRHKPNSQNTTVLKMSVPFLR
jgi:competence protein ComFC